MESHPATTKVDVNTFLCILWLLYFTVWPVEVRGYAFLILFFLYCKQSCIYADKVALEVWWSILIAIKIWAMVYHKKNKEINSKNLCSENFLRKAILFPILPFWTGFNLLTKINIKLEPQAEIVASNWNMNRTKKMEAWIHFTVVRKYGTVQVGSSTSI